MDLTAALINYLSIRVESAKNSLIVGNEQKTKDLIHNIYCNIVSYYEMIDKLNNNSISTEKSNNSQNK